ncbi:MAG: hypothetical protein ACK4SY_07785 [Pyrobaculum sp.]
MAQTEQITQVQQTVQTILKHWKSIKPHIADVFRENEYDERVLDANEEDNKWVGIYVVEGNETPPENAKLAVKISCGRYVKYILPKELYGDEEEVEISCKGGFKIYIDLQRFVEAVAGFVADELEVEEGDVLKKLEFLAQHYPRQFAEIVVPIAIALGPDVEADLQPDAYYHAFGLICRELSLEAEVCEEVEKHPFSK